MTFCRPDLGIKKLSKPPCYNALFSSNLLIYNNLSVSFAFFTLRSRRKQGLKPPCSVELRGGSRAIRSTMRLRLPAKLGVFDG